jgi:hypothetical protein
MHKIHYTRDCMKKKHLTYAGIISALILAGMFIAICLSQIPFPFLPPGTTFDPITDANIDGNNMMVLTGTTNLPSEFTLLFVTVRASPPFLSQGNTTGTPEVISHDSQVIAEPGGKNRWKGIVNISSLSPGDYTITLSKYTVDENFKMNESHPVATQHFSLSDENAGAGNIRKKTRIVLPFIRINPVDQQPAAKKQEISGITSLAPGTPLAWSMRPVNGGTGNSTQEYQGTARVFSGTVGINRWSVLTGTSIPEPGRYQFRITGNPAADATPISAIAEFDIPPVPGTLQNTTGTAQFPREFITIDTLPDIRTNNMYLITGTTSLPAGNDLLFQIHPASFVSDYNFSFDQQGNQIAEMSGVTGMVKIMNGSGGTNLWSIDVNSYSLIPARYEVNVSNDRYEFNSSEMVNGNVFSSRIIIVRGDPP